MRVAALLVAVATFALAAGAAAATPGGSAAKKRAQAAAAKAAKARAKAAPTPNDPLWQSEWGPRLVRMPAVWQLPASRRIVVAVVDTGVDPNQPDLRGLLVPGWNALDGTADASDDGGHGTMVAGIVAAHANNGVGVAGYCRSCVVMPVKVLDGAGHGTSDTLAAGIDWAVAHGANVVNLSLTMTVDNPVVAAAVARAVAAGVVVVASAGNGSGAAAAYPAADPGVISVAGEDPSRALYAWSGGDGWATTAGPGCNQSTTLGGGFGEFCGTSSATAAVSGIVGAALARRAASPAEVARAVAASSSGPTHALDAAALAAALAP